MKSQHLLISLALALGLTLALTLMWALGRGSTPALAAPRAEPVAAPNAPAAEIHVCPAGPPTCDYASVQAAVDAANPGDVIKVATGAYAGVNNYGGLAQAVHITKSLTIRGGYTTADWNTSDPDANPTTLDADGQGRVIYIAGVITVTIAGLYLTGGDATGLGGDPFGDAGGGVYVLSATVTLSRTAIVDNIATNDSWSDGLGGGVYAAESVPTLRHNLILNNRAAIGGLFFGGMGGGLYFINSQPTLEGNQIRRNKAGGGFGTGGGVEMAACSGFTLINNVIADNQADYGGSGIYIGHASGVPSHGRLLHSTIARNQATNVAGVWVAGGSVVTLTNTILVGHDTGINVSFGSTATLTATLWGSGAWANNTDWDDVGTIFTGTINIWGDPVFLSPNAGDYHISTSSAARNKGVAAGVSTDLDGNHRDASPDLGAYEAGALGALQVTKTALGPGSGQATAFLLNPGDTVTYSVSITNAGASGMTQVTLTDTLPALQRPLNATTDLGTCSIVVASYGGQLTCAIGNLGGAQAAHVTVVAQVTTTVPMTLPQTMRNTVEASSDQAQSSAYADTLLQNCHARVNGSLPEYSTVQAAVDAAGPNGQVWIAGTCGGAFERTGKRQQVYLTKSLTLRGGYSTDFSTWNPDAYPTILDADGQGRVIYVEGPVNVTAEALSLTGSDATGLGGLPEALGDAGGGLYAITATVTLSRSHVSGNAASTTSDGFGGGVGVTTATLTLIETILVDNTASRASLASGYGGGLFGDYSTVRLVKSRLENNAASGGLVGMGGGAHLYESDLDANATVWLSNTVSSLGWGMGGGLYVAGTRPFTLTNCVLADNWADDGSGQGGSGLWVEGAPGVLLHPTIARNQGGEGVSLELTATVAITNGIIVSHSLGIRAEAGSTASVNGVLWYDNINGNISGTIQVNNAYTGTPAFAADGYHLTGASNAIDRDVDAGVTTDIDGQARDIKPDLGADEYMGVCACDFDHDEWVEMDDIQTVANLWRDPAQYQAQYDIAPVVPDGVINILDIMAIAAHWGEACPH